MKNLGLNEIREKYLSFFESKEHLRLGSSSLVPNNDKSLLLINSGMAPLKAYFSGQEIPPSKRVTTCQKCIRTGDIENVGKTARHGTFFEMLGNFSFGDYFKEEIISWAWEFVTKDMEIPADKLYISVFEEDDEALKIWNEKMGIDISRIFKMGRDDNFWEVGLGPCGPCSEIYYDRGEAYGCGSPNCTVGCDCDRYMEFWNLVFTQFSKEIDGTYSKLNFPNIDTGMGLERMAAMMQNVSSIFDVDTIKAIRDKICEKAKINYNEDSKKDVSIRVITDHIRSITFMTADGVLPSNEGRGYVLRRLLRRAARHGKLLGIKDTFLIDLCKTVIEVSKEAYPELEEKKDYIFKVLSVEEDRFYETLDQGMDLLKNQIEKLRGNLETKLIGTEAFKLYDTFGFPFDLMKEILEEEGFSIDEQEFLAEMEKQKTRARQAREESNYMGSEVTIYNELPIDEKTIFVGYTENETKDSKILALIANDKICEQVTEEDEVSVILSKTPFYAESGGQKGDNGVLKTENGEINITDCIKIAGNKFAHIGKVSKGTFKNGEVVTAIVDMDKRISTARNHTATHLLQKALKEILGNHVEQAGSLVGSDKFRFDFTHFTHLTPDEIEKVEKIVNEKIFTGLNVEINEKPIDEARKLGAMALFGEKYDEIVRVVDMENYSIELCGGTHVKNTSQIGIFKIISESGIAAGVRRIEGLTGRGALDHFNRESKKISFISQLLKTAPDNIINRIELFMSNAKELSHEIEKLKVRMSKNIVDDIIKDSNMINECLVVISKVDDLDINSLRMMGDQIRDKIKSGIIVLASSKDDKVNLITVVTEDIVKKGGHAGNIIKQIAVICGGGGGGKPTMAQAGGKDISKINEALETAKTIIQNQLN